MIGKPDLRTNTRLDHWYQSLFWTWNAIFLAFMLLGFAPLQLPQLIQGIESGVTPPRFLVQSLVLIAIPVVSILIGALFFRKRPIKLFSLGYVFEWPLLLVFLFHFVFIGEGNPAITVLLIWLVVAEAIFLWHLLDEQIETRHALWRYLRLGGLTLLFSGTIYAAVWLLFYVPVLVVVLADIVASTVRSFSEMIRYLRWDQWYAVPLSITGYVLLLFSATLILLMPAAGPILAGRAWLLSLRSTLKNGNRFPSLAVTILPLALVLSLLAVSMIQPQQKAFQLLETPPESVQQAQFLMENEEQIRAGLLNAYLSRFRYMSSIGEVRHIRDMYQDILGFTRSDALRLEQAYEWVIRPFLYVPASAVDANASDNQVISRESREAAVLYQRVFDRTIEEGERQTVVNAVRSTSNSVQADLAWQAVDDREVHLNRQEIKLTEHGDWAEIEIYEAYENRTTQRQEVVYYFSLPESAVVTGLWLGNHPDKDQAFVYHVAPRGAAQAVYRNEVRYNRDPALLEQIGPRQYRLRVFPLEPQLWVSGSERPKPGPELHLWMTYRTVAIDGSWPLPRLAIKRNVYWDQHTVRTANDQPLQVNESESAWLPDALPATNPVVPVLHRVDLPGGQTVVARPAQAQQTPPLPENLRLAVVLDRSGSMRAQSDEVGQAIASLKSRMGAGPEPDLYLTSSDYRGEKPARVGLMKLDPAQVLYFGGQNAAELIAQFEDLQGGKQYDLIMVLTDGSGYELGEGNIQLSVPDAPLWVVHLGGGFPLGYDDPTQQAIQASGGGVASSVEEAFSRFAASREAPGHLDIVDGYVWQTLSADQAAALPVDFRSTEEESGFSAMAARRVILAEMVKNHGSLDQLPILDQLHQLAVTQSIVTPYSSMLVLVNQSQEDLLKQLSEKDDRYQREVESIGETGQASPFAVTGVPEPEEWLLLILMGLMLGYVGWRKLSQKTHAPVRYV